MIAIHGYLIYISTILATSRSTLEFRGIQLNNKKKGWVCNEVAVLVSPKLYGKCIKHWLHLSLPTHAILVKYNQLPPKITMEEKKHKKKRQTEVHNIRTTKYNGRY